MRTHYIKKKLYTYLSRGECNRDKWVIDRLNMIPQGHKLLDAGAGEQKFKQYCKHLEYVSQDFCEYDGKGDKTGLQTDRWDISGIDIVGNIWDIDVDNESFDAILCTDVFEHIPYPNETIKEFHRILRQGGTLILTAPFCSITHFAPYHFYSGYNIYYYKKILSENGFIIDSIERNGTYFEWLLQEFVRLPRVANEYAHCKVGPLYFLVLLYMLIKLKLLSRKGNESSGLLCFGYLVHAHNDH